MAIKIEVTGAAKPVQTRLCGSDGGEGAGIAVWNRMLFCWSPAGICCDGVTDAT